jgi:hypothetical protein
MVGLVVRGRAQMLMDEVTMAVERPFGLGFSRDREYNGTSIRVIVAKLLVTL